MPFSEINGLQLFYQEQGPQEQGPAAEDAPTIVMVHGTQGNASVWAGLFDAFSDRYRCAALNHRGRAPSEAPDDPDAYRIEQFADDQAAFIDQRGYERIVMVGWSLGVRTTLSYLDRHGSSRVAGAILVGGPPSPRFGGQPLQDPNREAPPREVWGQRFEAVSEACWQGSQASRASCDLESVLPTLDLPVAILHGRQDPIAPYAAAEFMAEQLPDATLVPFEESRHAPIFSEPEQFVAEMTAFLDRVLASSG